MPSNSSEEGGPRHEPFELAEVWLSGSARRAAKASGGSKGPRDWRLRQMQHAANEIGVCFLGFACGKELFAIKSKEHWRSEINIDARLFAPNHSPTKSGFEICKFEPVLCVASTNTDFVVDLRMCKPWRL